MDLKNIKKVMIVGVCLITSVVKLEAQVLNLQQCIDVAIHKNVQLNITRRTNDIYNINLTQAENARYPSLSGNANQVFSFGKSLNPVTYQYVNQSIQTNAFSINSSFVIFQGFQLKNTIKQDKLLYEAGKMDIENYKNTIILGVAGSYLQILLDNELVKIAQNTIESDKQQIEITKVMVTAGSVPQLNLFQIQSQLATDQLTLVNYQNQLALDKLTLEQLMDKPDSTGFTIDMPVLSDPPASIDSVPPTQIYMKSVENQPQVKSTEMKHQGAELGVNIAGGAAYPRLVLNSSISTNYSSSRNTTTAESVSYQNQKIGYLFSNPTESVYGPAPLINYQTINNPFFKQFGDNIGEGFTFALSIPIFNNYQIRANVEQSKINRDVAMLNDKYTKEQFRKTIEQSWLDFIGTHKQFQSASEALKAETEAYKTMEIKYKGGASNASELILEKNKFVTSQSQMAQAKYNFIFKQKVLEFYQGKQITL